ncbi:MAG: EAL domain-containing protein [Pseudomonadota bacterium]
MTNKKSSLQTRIRLLLLAVFIIMLALTVFFLRVIMLEGLNKLEDRYVSEHAGRVGNRIQEKLERMGQIAKDYAAWDDSYEYIMDHNVGFQERNLTEETLANLNLDLLIYSDMSGSFVFAGSLDEESISLIPIYSGIREQLEVSGILQNSDPGKTLRGIIRIDEGLMMVNSHPIIMSDYSGEVRGNLILGQLLDQEEIAEMGAALNLDLELQRLDLGHDPIFDMIHGTGRVIVEGHDKNSISAYTVLTDVFGQPAAGIVVSMNRDFSAVGLRAFELLGIGLCLTALLTMLIIGFVFNALVLKRLVRLSENVGVIGDDNSVFYRLPEDSGGDEISIVSGAINLMLGRLAESHTNLENEVILRTRELMETNEKLTKEINIRRQAQERIEYLAYYDTLTGLPNRALLVDRVHQAIDLAKRIEKPIGIMYIDLDRFKDINDTLGHFQGDELLKSVAGRLSSVVRESDTVARMNSDEFVVMALNLDNAEKIGTVARKLLNVFIQPFDANNREIYLTASIGISVFPTDGETPESLIKDADLAMYKAKDKGKNQCVFCTAVMKDIIFENLKLSNGLYRALQRNELEVYYQPQVSQGTRSIVGLEALLRWNHPEYGLVSPGKFIHLAEQTGLINPIGKWVLQSVCRQNKAWQEAGLPCVRIAVNLSIIQLQSPDIIEQIKEILRETGLESQYLELEITESIAMRDTEYIVNVLNEFRALGIYISIDDFGTEFSSLNYLKLLPINRIKIPMPFVEGIAVNERDEAIIKTIIVLAKNMGLDVIAEGVETKEQEAFLTRRMCNEMQGFYYYRPMCAADIENIMLKG